MPKRSGSSIRLNGNAAVTMFGNALKAESDVKELHKMLDDAGEFPGEIVDRVRSVILRAGSAPNLEAGGLTTCDMDEDESY